MIAIPALLLAGLPPLETLGAAKLQALFGSVSAAYAYGRNGHVRMQTVLPMSCLSLVGAVLGASLATILPLEILKGTLPLLLIFIAIYFSLKPDPGGVHRRRRIAFKIFGATVIPAIAFYDGLFGPGVGCFFMLAFVALAAVLTVRKQQKWSYCSRDEDSLRAYHGWLAGSLGIGEGS